MFTAIVATIAGADDFTEEYYHMFGQFLDITDLKCSMFEFQNHLKHIGRGQDITMEQIKSCIEIKDSKGLKSLLEELLLIPVDNTDCQLLNLKVIIVACLVKLRPV